MLKTRIITAAVLIGLLLLVIQWRSATVVAVTVLVLAGAWEWSAFLRLSGHLVRVVYVVGIAACLPVIWQLTLAAPGRLIVLAVAVLWWVVALLWVIFAPRRAAPWSAALAGLLALVPAWVAMVRLRLDVPRGAEWLLFVLALVWAADVGAYFAGRRFGRVRLAPAVSPGKTWEGVAGGAIASVLVAVWGSGLFGVSLAVFLPLCLGAVGFSIVGDLTESLLKRYAGLKDSGTLFPGHGGVMDRIDSITSAAPVLLFGLMALGVAPMKGIAVLGATGSIGVNTLDVLARHPDRYRLVALGAHRNAARLAEQVRQFRPHYAALTDPTAAQELVRLLAGSDVPTRVLAGPDALVQIATLPEVDQVMAAVVGAAGLASTLAAARAGKRLLLANKESLVMAGPLLMAEVHASGAVLLPIDSEHNAIFQCLPHGSRPGKAPEGVRRILLTASGGPFRDWSHEAICAATPEQACRHPNWVMGRKISVDSASLMNKGLELIEACFMFGVPPSKVQVLVHPQSVVHSMVEYIDGSVLAQLASPDMRTPIAYGLAWPERIEAGSDFLDLIRTQRLDFSAPDTARFPCLALARAAADSGGLAPAILNAANEVAVNAFLERRLNFPDIAAVIDKVVTKVDGGAIRSLDDVLQADAEARSLAMEWCGRHYERARPLHV